MELELDAEVVKIVVAVVVVVVVVDVVGRGVVSIGPSPPSEQSQASQGHPSLFYRQFLFVN